MNIFQNFLCTLFKYILLEETFFHQRCDRYPLSIDYCCPLTEAESVTKDCASRRNRLQNGQASLRKRVWILGCVCVGTFDHNKNTIVCYLSRTILQSISCHCVATIDQYKKIKLFGTELTWRCNEWNCLQLMKEDSNVRSSVNSISRCNPSIAPITFGKKRPTFSNSEANSSNGFGHRMIWCKLPIKASITTSVHLRNVSSYTPNSCDNVRK